MTTSEVAEIQAQQAENKRHLRLVSVYQQVRHPKTGQVLKNCEANDSAILETAMDPSMLNEALKRGIQPVERFLWAEPELTPQQKQQQRDNRKAVFEKACRHYKLSTCEANFSILEEFCDAEYLIQRAIESGAVSGLLPASQDQLDQWEQEAAAERTQQLKSMSKIDLRKAINEDYQHRRHAAQAAEATRVLEEKRKAEEQMNFPEIPQFFRGELVNAKFFQRCDRSTMRWFLQKFGESQVTAKIRGL